MIARVMGSIVDDSGLAPYRLVGKPEELAREGLFVAEGRLVLPRLLTSRYRVHSVLLSEPARVSLQPMLDAHPHVRTLVAPADTIAEVAGYNFHRGCLALGYRKPPPPLVSLLEPGARSLEPVLLLEGVNNPDNIGGIFRTAHAFGARAVILGPNCGDPLYRKAIRTSIGATLDVPWTTVADLDEAANQLRGYGHQLIALTPDPSAIPLREAVAGAAGSSIAFMLGSEGFGLSEEALSLAHTRARIPMQPDADSLNVAAAASIALYEINRDRPHLQQKTG